MPKSLITHEIYDPTRNRSRLLKFTLPDGETAFMDIFIVPKAPLGDATPARPTRTQTVQTIIAAATAETHNYL